MLRKRSSPRAHHEDTPDRRHDDDESPVHVRKHNARRNYPFILKATAALCLFIVFIYYLRPSRNTAATSSSVINLDSIETLSTVPLGFTINVPNDLGALEIYLDFQHISSAVGSAASLSTTEGQNKNLNIDIGTCDISDHGENIRKHAFSISDGGLGDMKIIYPKPGNHVIEIIQQQSNTHNQKMLMPYAQMTLKVNTPPQLILTSSSSSKNNNSPYENAYKLALEEIGRNIACNHFVAGTGWSQLWTRDTSYAAELGAALLHPNVVRTSLMASVEVLENGKKVWLQDKCGHFGGWPNLSDAIVGARGAWSLYLVTGDKEFLEWAYDVTKNSLQLAEEQVLDKGTGLFLGCSSFLESNSGYPEKYMNDGELVGKTKALSTNMLYYSGYNLAAKMGKELGAPDRITHDLKEKANSLKSTIQRRLWSQSKSNYAYFEDEFGMLVDTTEGLGTSLALLEFDDDERNSMMIKSTHTTEYGITCLWPQFKYSPGFFEWRIARHYHNGRLWPFVQGYWAMALAYHKQAKLFSDAFKGLTALSQKGNTFAEFYQLNGTYPEERRSQLWSATGYISMIYHGVFGIRLELGGMRFSPIKPVDLFPGQTIHLNNLRYRGMTLNIHLHGHGTTIESFELNHNKQSDPFINHDSKGVFDVDINLK